MVGKLDKEIIEKFKEFQKATGEYSDLDIDGVRFEKVFLTDKKYFEINPKKSEIDDMLLEKNIDVSFIPLANINPTHGKIEKVEVRKILDVKNGYTYFKENDVIFTKVTPSMENGNFAIAKNLINGIGFGSSEYHIFRCKNVHSKLLWFLFRADFFRNRAKKTMKGSGGLKRVPLDFFDTQYIPIPKDLNKFYSSYQIQEAIVEFFEYSFEKIERIRENIDKRYAIFERLKKALIPSTFIKDYVKVAFSRYAKEKGIDFNILDVEFEIKRIHSDKNDDPDVICKKRMGFTPATSSSGDINWFSVKDLGEVDELYISNPNSRKKTTMELIRQSVDKNNTGKSEKLIPIKKNDILISFKLTIGVVKIYNSTKPLYCNEAIDILTVDENVTDSRYVAYNCILEYPKYGTRTNNGVTLNDDDKKEIKIFIPKDLENYTSLEIQKIIADFIEYTENRLQKEFDKIAIGYNNLERLHKTYLARTFCLIDWGE